MDDYEGKGVDDYEGREWMIMRGEWMIMRGGSGGL